MDFGFCGKMKAPTCSHQSSSDTATEPVTEDPPEVGRAPEPVISHLSEPVHPRRIASDIDRDSTLPVALQEKYAYAATAVQSLGPRIKCSVEEQVLRDVRALGRHLEASGEVMPLVCWPRWRVLPISFDVPFEHSQPGATQYR